MELSIINSALKFFNKNRVLGIPWENTVRSNTNMLNIIFLNNKIFVFIGIFLRLLRDSMYVLNFIHF